MATTPMVNVGYDSANYYLLGKHRPRLLIDVGWPGTLPKLCNVLKRKGIDLQDVGYLLCTHYHPDHAGLAPELQQHGVQLVIVETQLAAVPALRQYMKPQHQFRDIDVPSAIHLPIRHSRQFLQEIAIAGEIIGTPGHSDDSITLVLDAGIAFTGDLPPTFDMGQDPSDPINLSWQRIAALGAQTIYPGHGPARRL